MPDETGNSRIPIVEERATLDKQVVPTGRVRITSRVEERIELLREELIAQTVAVERVAVNREVETLPGMTQRG